MRNIKQAFTSLVGNYPLKNKLLSDILTGTLSHAYIIEGKKGSGKHTVAYTIAAALSCENVSSENYPLPCLECPSCKKILQFKSPDVITIGRDGKATLGVDTVRFLKNDIRTVPNELEFKIYIIEDAHTMTDQAQNAFLLSLEEPPSFVKFFLLCEDSDSLLETIRSRAQILRTEPINEEDIDKYLQNNYDSAKKLKKTDPHIYEELLMSAENCIGRAIDLLDPKEFKYVEENRALARDFLQAVSQKESGEKIYSLFSRFDNKREGFTDQLSTISLALRDLIVLQRAENVPLIFYYNRDEAITLTDSINMRKLMKTYSAICNAENAISANANVKLTLTKLFSDIDLI